MTESMPRPLVILDVQDAIDQPVWAAKNNPDYLENIVRLLSHWRQMDWPVLHVKHDEANPASTYAASGPWNGIKAEVAPIGGETIIVKTQNCAFIGTELDRELKALGVNRFILTGVVIHNSIDATVRAGRALGYTIDLPLDATTAVPVTGLNGQVWEAQTVFDVTAAILASEYVLPCTVDELLADRTD
ncbi:isochorismatase family protein [Parvularcula sp. LCG005]|uniref:isochorismatase family protein n=1 Tax=Parvularcula sp. LCG005 TaxID=3078805 RepID=UPI002942BF81|nr:isochorismatase family protein [Parvularcula sp. LCG005]WOI53695.1 isochorismatase family protein [Parvularcula sp. LCG005]